MTEPLQQFRFSMGPYLHPTARTLNAHTGAFAVFVTLAFLSLLFKGCACKEDGSIDLDVLASVPSSTPGVCEADSGQATPNTIYLLNDEIQADGVELLDIRFTPKVNKSWLVPWSASKIQKAKQWQRSEAVKDEHGIPVRTYEGFFSADGTGPWVQLNCMFHDHGCKSGLKMYIPWEEIAHPLEVDGQKYVALYGFPGPVGEGNNLTVRPVTQPGQIFCFCHGCKDGDGECTHPDGIYMGNRFAKGKAKGKDADSDEVESLLNKRMLEQFSYVQQVTHSTDADTLRDHLTATFPASTFKTDAGNQTGEWNKAAVAAIAKQHKQAITGLNNIQAGEDKLDMTELTRNSAKADIDHRSAEEKKAAQDNLRRKGTPIPSNAGTRHPEHNVRFSRPVIPSAMCSKLCHNCRSYMC